MFHQLWIEFANWGDIHPIMFLVTIVLLVVAFVGGLQAAFELDDMKRQIQELEKRCRTR